MLVSRLRRPYIHRRPTRHRITGPPNCAFRLGRSFDNSTPSISHLQATHTPILRKPLCLLFVVSFVFCFEQSVPIYVSCPKPTGLLYRRTITRSLSHPPHANIPRRPPAPSYLCRLATQLRKVDPPLTRSRSHAHTQHTPHHNEVPQHPTRRRTAKFNHFDLKARLFSALDKRHTMDTDPP